MASDKDKDKSQNKDSTGNESEGWKLVLNSNISPCRRIIWMAIFIVMSGLFLRLIALDIIKYFEYPFHISAEVIHHQNLTLPDITVCNNNKVRQSVISRYIAAKKWYALNSLTSNEIQDISNLPSDVKHWLKETDGVSFLHEALDDVDDFFPVCFKYRSPPADCAKLTARIWTFSGLCYTISSSHLNAATKDLFLTTKPGPNFSLGLVIRINQSEYSSAAESVGAGIKVMLHQAGEYPDESRAFAASPGSELHIAISTQETHKLGSPYQPINCHRENLTYHAAENSEAYYFPTIYSKEGCAMFNYLDYFKRFCQCSLTGTDVTLPNCTMSQIVSCSYHGYNYVKVKEADPNGESYKCAPPCSETIYNIQPSSMLSPSTKGVEVFKRNFNYSMDYMRENMLILKLFYSSLNVNILSQHPTYSQQSLVSDIGGQLGLLLGASLIDLSQTIESILLFLYGKFLTDRDRNKVQVISSE